MEFEVYIKDNSFLPDTVDVKVNTTVIFRNTDSIAHTIHCKGHATFPSLSVGPNRSASFEFDKPGRYEISAADMGDMRCIIEATVQEPEATPKRIYFPTSKDRALHEGAQRLASMNAELAAKLETTPTSPADFADLLVSGNSPSISEAATTQPLDGYRGKWGGTAGTYPFGPAKGTTIATSDSDSGEEAELARQRQTVKSTKREGSGRPKGMTAVSGVKSDFASLPLAPAQSKVSGLKTSTSTNTKANASTTTAASVKVTSLPPPPPPQLPSTNALFATITIEDYAFSPTDLTIHVGQAVHFVLADSVPAHAEHELWGKSDVKALCFEAPLLQKGESVRFVYAPTVPGEVTVSCRIYPDMICTIAILPAPLAPVTVSGSLLGQARAASGSASSSAVGGAGSAKGKGAKKTGAQVGSSVDSGALSATATAAAGTGKVSNTPSTVTTPSTVVASSVGPAAPPASPPQLRQVVTPSADPSTHTTPSGTVVFTPAGKRSPLNASHADSAVAGSAARSATSPTSPSTPAVQGTGSRVLKIDAAVGILGKNGERTTAAVVSDESSHGSFYDSDDVFSDVEAPKGNLERIFNAAEAQRAPTRDTDSSPSGGNYSSEALFGLQHNAISPTSSANAVSASSVVVENNSTTQAGFARGTPFVGVRSPARQIHNVHWEDYQFRPNHVLIKPGETVRFCRAAGQPAVTLVCVSEFPPSTTSTLTPIAGLEDEYLTFSHTFERVGKFTIENEIYPFSTCTVMVQAPNTGSSGGGLTQRKTNTPALRGSFTGAVPAQPVFHKPITLPGDTLPPARQSPHKLPPLERATGTLGSTLAPTTTTTVNATTTSVVFTSAACADVAPVHSAQRAHSPSSPSDETAASTVAEAVGSAADAYLAQIKRTLHPTEDTETFINNMLAADLRPLGAIPRTTQTSSTAATDSAGHASFTNGKNGQRAPSMGAIDEDGESEEAAEDAAAVEAQAKKKAAKNRKKKEKAKLKAQQKRLEAEMTALAGDEAAPTFVAAVDSEDEKVNEMTPLLPKEGGQTHRAPGEGVGKYQSDADRERAYLRAQADWQEEFSSGDEAVAVEEGRAVPRASRVTSVVAPPATTAAAPTPVSSGPAPPASTPAAPAAPAAPTSTVPTLPAINTTEAALTAADLAAAELLGEVSREEEEANRKAAKNRKKKEKEKAKAKARKAEAVEAPTIAEAAEGAVHVADKSEKVVVVVETPGVNEDHVSTAEPTVKLTALHAADIEKVVERSELEQPHSAQVFDTPPRRASPPTATLLETPPARTTTSTASIETVRVDEGSSGSGGDGAVAATRTTTAAGTTAAAVPESASKSSLLRSALKISPQKASEPAFPTTPRGAVEMELTSTSVPATPRGISGEDNKLSMLLAYEVQMEEIFVSRLERMQELRKFGRPDRMPSGNEVEIIYLEDLLLTKHTPAGSRSAAPAKGNQRGGGSGGGSAGATGSVAASAGGGGGGGAGAGGKAPKAPGSSPTAQQSKGGKSGAAAGGKGGGRKK